MTPFGSSLLNPNKVIEKKYIYDGSGAIGYYSGITLLNKIGLSAQVPNIIDIYTNNETSKVREVTVGKQRVVLRKARTTITADNAAVQSFLELYSRVINISDAGQEKEYDIQGIYGRLQS